MAEDKEFLYSILREAFGAVPTGARLAQYTGDFVGRFPLNIAARALRGELTDAELQGRLMATQHCRKPTCSGRRKKWAHHLFCNHRKLRLLDELAAVKKIFVRRLSEANAAAKRASYCQRLLVPNPHVALRAAPLTTSFEAATTTPGCSSLPAAAVIRPATTPTDRTCGGCAYALTPAGGGAYSSLVCDHTLRPRALRAHSSAPGAACTHLARAPHFAGSVASIVCNEPEQQLPYPQIGSPHHCTGLSLTLKESPPAIVPGHEPAGLAPAPRAATLNMPTAANWHSPNLLPYSSLWRCPWCQQNVSGEASAGVCGNCRKWWQLCFNVHTNRARAPPATRSDTRARCAACCEPLNRPESSGHRQHADDYSLCASCTASIIERFPASSAVDSYKSTMTPSALLKPESRSPQPSLDTEPTLRAATAAAATLNQLALRSSNLCASAPAPSGAYDRDRPSSASNFAYASHAQLCADSLSLASHTNPLKRNMQLYAAAALSRHVGLSDAATPPTVDDLLALLDSSSEHRRPHKRGRLNAPAT